MANVEKNKNEGKHFFKDFKAELKKVIWPTPKQVANNTVAVITIVLLTAAIVFVLDLAFETLNTHGVNRLRNIVKTEESATQENTIENTVENTVNSNTIAGDNTIENNTISE